MIGPDRVLPLPWLAAPLAQALGNARGHALLVQGAAGGGALAFAAVLAQSRLCDAPVVDTGFACGRCDGCHLVQARLHPDLFLLMPEQLRRDEAWPLVGDRFEAEEGRRRPSRQIRIDELRDLIDWASRSDARGRGKVAVLHPADAMNHAAANALLKTLEEPTPSTRLVLTAADAGRLLPTVRSRCQTVRLPLPDAASAEQWLRQQGVQGAAVLLAACGGLPLEALAWSRDGWDAARWEALPAALAQEDAAVLAGWPVPRVIEALGKVCHDTLAVQVGGRPKYFSKASLATAARSRRLLEWARDLQRLARHDEHPWNEALLVQSLVAAAAHALQPDRPAASRPRRPLDTLAR